MILDIVPMGAVRYTQASRFRSDWQRYCQYKTDLLILARASRYSVQVPLSITFYLPMPASWSKKKREEMDRQPHQNKPDLDNLIKAFKDALLSEDSGVWKYGEMEKRWATRGFIVVL